MTVAQLRDILSRLDQSLPVWIDGCDCDDKATAVHPGEDYITITREDSEYIYPIGTLLRPVTPVTP